MSPGGAVEETAKVATGIVDALKAQPAVLALSLAQIAMLVFMFYALFKAAEFRNDLIKQQFEFAHKTTELLARCIVPQRSVYPSEPAKPLGEVPEPTKPLGEAQ